ncbi:MAG: hypothetical protein ACYDAA_05100 [Syntrophales bacterium]
MAASLAESARGRVARGLPRDRGKEADRPFIGRTKILRSPLRGIVKRAETITDRTENVNCVGRTVSAGTHKSAQDGEENESPTDYDHQMKGESGPA